MLPGRTLQIVLRAGAANAMMGLTVLVCFPPSVVAQTEVRLAVMATAPGTVGGKAPFDLVLGNVLQTDVAEVFADLRFDPNVLSLDLDQCMLTADIATSHVLEGGTTDGEAQLDVVSAGAATVLPAGPLVHCAFDVAPGIPAGTTGVTFAGARTVDPEGSDVDVITLRGVIIYFRGTPVPTPTRTVGPTFTVRSASGPSDCSVVPPDQANTGARWLLLAGAMSVLVLRPRRRSTE